jgi:hypothetical protein
MDLPADRHSLQIGCKLRSSTVPSAETRAWRVFPLAGSGMFQQILLLIMCIELHLQPVRYPSILPLTYIEFNIFPPFCLLEDKLHSSHCPPLSGRPEWRLTILLGSTAVMPIAVPKKKRTLLPLLTVVFLFSYGLMTLLIVEQNTTIQAQKNLIQVLLGDSKELWAAKAKVLTDRSARDQARRNAQALPNHGPSTHGQAPSVQSPSTQAPSTQVPLNQAPHQHSQSRAGKGAKPNTQVPPVPASDLTDQRRVLITL